MTSLSGIGNAGYNPYSIQQSLFNEIDTSGIGSITKSELEQAVTTAGGTTTAADALYATLDPNNTGSVTAQQFAQNLPAPPFSDQMGAQMIGFQAQGWPGAGGAAGTDPASQIAQLFSQISGGAGSITKAELEQAVAQAGGTTQAADALYAQLDPNNTGSVSEQQFAQFLQPPSPSGTTAQDAVMALIDSSFEASSTSSATGNNCSTDTSSTSSTAASSGSTAQDALMALFNSLGTNNNNDSGTGTSGNTPQDALLALLDGTAGSGLGALGGSTQDPLLALLQGTGTDSGITSDSSAQDALLAVLQASSGASASATSSSGTSSSGTTAASSAGGSTGSDITAALALYQSQINQQMLSTMFGGNATSI
jgi:Ca2+-binding EF-hand superfamily protein